MAIASGRLQIRDWQDNNGNKRRSAEVIADSIYFGDSKPQDAQPAVHATNVDASDFDEIEDDPDIPF